MTQKTKIIISVILAGVLTFCSVFAYNYFGNNAEADSLAFNDTIEISSEDIQKSRNVGANIGSGGGSNYGDASGSGTSITGTVRDEGVRVTLVDAETG